MMFFYLPYIVGTAMLEMMTQTLSPPRSAEHEARPQRDDPDSPPA